VGTQTEVRLFRLWTGEVPGGNETISSILVIPGGGAKTYSRERNLAESIFLHFIRETQERSYRVVAIDVRRHAPSEREAARRDVREETLGMDIFTIFQLLVAASVERGRTLRVTHQPDCDEFLRMGASGLVDIYLHLEGPEHEVTVRRLTARGRRVLRAFASPLRPGRVVRAVRKTKVRKTRDLKTLGGNMVRRVPRLRLKSGDHHV
jgi:hypothetical protein